jgi:hypothetical protein
MNILVAYQRQAAWLFRGTHMGTKNTGVRFCAGTFTEAQVAGGSCRVTRSYGGQSLKAGAITVSQVRGMRQGHSPYQKSKGVLRGSHSRPSHMGSAATGALTEAEVAWGPEGALTV